MNALPRALILARSTDDAERAARFVVGDADIEVGGESASAARPGGGPGYGSVVVAGDLADDAWLSAACRGAAVELCIGGRLLVVLAERPFRAELPADVVEVWSVVGAVVEYGTTAIVLARAAEVDGALDTAESFGSWQQFEALAGAVAERARAARTASASYRGSALRRVTTWYRLARRRLRERCASGSHPDST